MGQAIKTKQRDLNRQRYGGNASYFEINVALKHT